MKKNPSGQFGRTLPVPGNILHTSGKGGRAGTFFFMMRSGTGKCGGRGNHYGDLQWGFCDRSHNELQNCAAEKIFAPARPPHTIFVFLEIFIIFPPVFHLPGRDLR